MTGSWFAVRFGIESSLRLGVQKVGDRFCNILSLFLANPCVVSEEE
jgi:hypothetical protein